MYTSIIRPLAFKLSPENAHKAVFTCLKLAQNIGLGSLTRKILHPSSLHLETVVCGIKFPNKIGIAAGLDKNAEAYKMLGNMGFGHVEIGTVTPKSQPGNPKPRSFRLPKDKALINRMGFNNNGLDSAINKLKKRNSRLIIGGNIGKNTITPNSEALNDYICCFNGLYDYVDYIVVNVSCPNVTDLHKLQDQDALEEILQKLTDLRKEKSIYKPIFLKISPDLNAKQIDETIDVVYKCNTDGIIATNTTIKRDHLSSEKAKIKAIGNGGLSGLPIKDRSTELIRYISNKTQGNLPIIGVGGVFSAKDAIEKIEAGASLVQVYSGFIYEGPSLGKRINKALKDKLHM
ncbi:MAG: quinone-dependent dihydroorotate dehydrogenase [Salinivirgaceae bacterium]|nr:quinone-dependent dihydroorotate dehydrogenase [Salinivirgaceae bacterium]